MKIRRLRILLLSLFLTATVASALHTVSHHHAHDNCPICTVAEHTAAPDVIATFQTFPDLPFDAVASLSYESIDRLAVQFAPLRAPPFFRPFHKTNHI
ncbi:MAG: hypothetical protein P8Y65_05005 [Campylobacterales bacterium]|jgi:hypothetical protein